METLTPQRSLADRYRLEAPLDPHDGQITWRATDTVLERSVRIRTVPPGYPTDPFLDLMRRASRCLAPTLVPVLDVDTDGGIAFAVLAMPEGAPLEGTLHEGPLSSPQAVRTAIAILQGLIALDDADVPHRPPTAHDVYGMGDDARVDVLADDTHATPANHTYAVAALLYRCLTGVTPDRTPVPPRSIDARIDRAIEDIVLRGLSGDIASPNEFLGALSRIRFDDAQLGDHHAPDHHLADTGWFRSWMFVPIAIAIATAAIIIGGRTLANRADETEPVARQTPAFAPLNQPPQRPTPELLTAVRVRALDPPPGDGSEGTPAWAIDGDRATVWQTEDYFGGTMNKPGVGLLVDLGDTTTVTGYRLRTPVEAWPFQIRVGDDPETMVRTRGQAFTAEASMREPLRPVDGRYVLVWVTDVTEVDDGSHRAVISEVQIEGIPGGKRA